MSDSVEGLRKFRDDLWRKIVKETAEAVPIPGDLTELEEEALLVMRLGEKSEQVSEAEMKELLKRACDAKFMWDNFRAAMAGIFNLSIKDGELMIGLTDRFVEENPHLHEVFSKKAKS